MILITMNVTEATEIRKLTPTFTLELSRLLQNSWKDLMSKIPEKLEKEKYECKLVDNNIPKYNSDHIRIIEHASFTTKRFPSDILFEEWGSSGRIRPTLGHLLFLLQECRLYGAADYVAKILGKSPPRRPHQGPEAKIELTPTERRQIENTNSDVRNALEQMNYPSYIEAIHESEVSRTQNLPEIIIDQHESIDNNHQVINSLYNSSTDNITNNVQIHNSDLIQFSSNRLPDISNLLNNSNQSVHITQNDAVQVDVPHFSALLNDSSHSIVQQNSNLPDISMLNDSIISSALRSNSSPNIPDFDALRSDSSVSSQNASIPRTLGSPLPSLALNTPLKHYPYSKIEIASNYFNETPYINTFSQDPSCGRFLGSGAFGSVFLAFGLLDKPIAVKRINLHELNIVRADDFITKQFTTEVEILYKYRHDNLLSLLGYSCDGMTYCLLYEYVPGGNLKDRLQVQANSLNWMERLDIGIGTADAVAYLHTAYSTPLIHRDIKSANILLDDRNQPKLGDFGIMRISSSSSTTTGTNQILGTSAYMSPEAHRGDVSVKMDTYSFGVVLLELLTGLPPVDFERNGNDIVTYVQDNLEDETDITPLLDIKAGMWQSENTNYSIELYKITMRCLQEKKNVRPTMVNVRDDMRTLLVNRML